MSLNRSMQGGRILRTRSQKSLKDNAELENGGIKSCTKQEKINFVVKKRAGEVSVNDKAGVASPELKRSPSKRSVQGL